MENMFPIWDATATRILQNEDGTDIMLTETEVRKNIGARKLGVSPRRSKDGERKVVLRAEEHEVFERPVRRLDPGQPYCVRITVGEHHHAFMHVRERCESFYNGRDLCIGTDGEGNPVYTRPQISSRYL